MVKKSLLSLVLVLMCGGICAGPTNYKIQAETIKEGLETLFVIHPRSVRDGVQEHLAKKLNEIVSIAKRSLKSAPEQACLGELSKCCQTLSMWKPGLTSNWVPKTQHHMRQLVGFCEVRLKENSGDANAADILKRLFDIVTAPMKGAPAELTEVMRKGTEIMLKDVASIRAIGRPQENLERVLREAQAEKARTALLSDDDEKASACRAAGGAGDVPEVKKTSCTDRVCEFVRSFSVSIDLRGASKKLCKQWENCFIAKRYLERGGNAGRLLIKSVCDLADKVVVDYGECADPVTADNKMDALCITFSSARVAFEREQFKDRFDVLLTWIDDFLAKTQALEPLDDETYPEARDAFICRPGTRLCLEKVLTVLLNEDIDAFTRIVNEFSSNVVQGFYKEKIKSEGLPSKAKDSLGYACRVLSYFSGLQNPAAPSTVDDSWIDEESVASKKPGKPNKKGSQGKGKKAASSNASYQPAGSAASSVTASPELAAVTSKPVDAISGLSEEACAVARDACAAATGGAGASVIHVEEDASAKCSGIAASGVTRRSVEKEHFGTLFNEIFTKPDTTNYALLRLVKDAAQKLDDCKDLSLRDTGMFGCVERYVSLKIRTKDEFAVLIRALGDKIEALEACVAECFASHKSDEKKRKIQTAANALKALLQVNLGKFTYTESEEVASLTLAQRRSVLSGLGLHAKYSKEKIGSSLEGFQVTHPEFKEDNPRPWQLGTTIRLAS